MVSTAVVLLINKITAVMCVRINVLPLIINISLMLCIHYVCSFYWSITRLLHELCASTTDAIISYFKKTLQDCFCPFCFHTTNKPQECSSGSHDPSYFTKWSHFCVYIFYNRIDCWGKHVWLWRQSSHIAKYCFLITNFLTLYIEYCIR